MHKMKSDIEALSSSILAYAMERLRMDPPTIDHALPQTTLEELAAHTITEEGLGGEAAARVGGRVARGERRERVEAPRVRVAEAEHAPRLAVAVVRARREREARLLRSSLREGSFKKFPGSF